MNPGEHHHLTVNREGPYLVIRIGIESLRNACDFMPNAQYELKIIDLDSAVNAIIGELRSEAEDGSTLVHRMFDKAYMKAYENGCEGIEEVEIK